MCSELTPRARITFVLNRFETQLVVFFAIFAFADGFPCRLAPFLTLHLVGQEILGKILLHRGCTPSYALVDFDDVMI